MADWCGKFNVPHTLAPDPRVCHSHSTFLADDPAETNSLVFSTGTRPAPGWPEDLLAEEPILDWFEGTIVQRFRLSDLARTPAANVLSTGQASAHASHIVKLDHTFFFLLSWYSLEALSV